ncbi:hypothetical protein ASPNIDRAFT_40909 [Aspergillus niger ATCC 1015]|uniref:Uncharacterized protein n=1 Tax=Aspergillus niger (strain ATCC 1015 / CBS 113.46 / FGSC A1144 / LSHB Ac4 / NCTC 3858a / NRRL 328 / USDA 3528.7) TaxID=380704 RepID=G3Y6F6_ASPNA|nr:hypothetical protein ASPNIDRAFT_40909 [Aspergillus niger ATCC 1015]
MQWGIESLNAEGIHQIFGVLPPAPADINHDTCTMYQLPFEVLFDLQAPEDEISAAIELSRFADMCALTSLESQMARRIKEISKANPEPQPFTGKHVDMNTYCLTPEHIIWATFLPDGHAVRHVLAAASIDGYFRDENHKFEEVQAYPTFGADVLQETIQLVNLLLEKNADAESEGINGWTPLLWAAANGCEGDNNGRTPLTWAARNGHEGTVKGMPIYGVALRHGYNIKHLSPRQGFAWQPPAQRTLATLDRREATDRVIYQDPNESTPD